MLSFLLACDALVQDEPTVSDWAIAPANIDSPRVSGSGFSPEDGAAIGGALAHFLPGFAEGNPAWEVPAAMVAIAMDDLVADPGSCPFEVREGDGSTFHSDCRSRDGYVWVGSYQEREWDDGEISRHAFTFDLTVTADVDEARFSSLTLDGTVVLGEFEGIAHVDVDLVASLTGYFEARGEGSDPRLDAWANWQASGSVEFSEALVRVEAAADIGGSGGVPMAGVLDLDRACPIEPVGELSLGGGIVAQFAGADACDACAEVVEGDQVVSQACAP